MIDELIRDKILHELEVRLKRTEYSFERNKRLKTIIRKLDKVWLHGYKEAYKDFVDTISELFNEKV